MYSINQDILYGAHGICKITCIEEHDFTGTPNQYYVLKPWKDQKSTIYVSMNNEKAVEQMRDILSADEIKEMIRSLSDVPCEWIENKNERNVKYRKIINSGDRKELMLMIKTLYLRREQQKIIGKKLHLTDEKFLKDAMQMLCEEFAVVLNLPQEQIIPMIVGKAEI